MYSTIEPEPTAYTSSEASYEPQPAEPTSYGGEEAIPYSEPQTFTTQYVSSTVVPEPAPEEYEGPQSQGEQSGFPVFGYQWLKWLMHW